MGRRSYPTVEQMRANLARIAAELTPAERAAGGAWYPAAHAWCARLAEEYGITTEQAAGVVAAMSPRQYWRANKAAAARIVAAYVAGAAEPPRVGLGTGLAQAWAILAGAAPLDILSGPKTRAFYRALMRDGDAVCVDSWGTRAATLGAWDQPRHYADTARAYALVAQQYGLSPRDMQAAIWCKIRGRGE